jgi:hypothetical protein
MKAMVQCRFLCALAASGLIVANLNFETRSVIAAPADEVLNWNGIATSVAIPGGKNAIQQSRIYAMVQLAVHDALNAIDHRYTSYAFSQEADPTASAPAAIATAAHDVLIDQIPAQTEAIEAAWVASLAAIAPGAAKDNGIIIGHNSAAAMLELRKDDGATIVTSYNPGTAPGEWRPTPNPDPSNPPGGGPGLQPAALPGWGNVTPFVLRNGAQFRPDGPPGLTSDKYAQDVDEVQAIGDQFSILRTEDQSTIARFWYESGSNSWNRIARNILGMYSLDSWDRARALALLNAAQADGAIASFNAKYHYNFWRPVTAIREADTDGNDSTVSDATWNTYLNTPAIPDYPSTHAAVGAAAAEVLAHVLHTDDVEFTSTSGVPFAGITRVFRSLSQAAQEMADSRVYAGIHFRSACQDGLQQGRKIGKFTVRHYLQPVEAAGNSQ